MERKIIREEVLEEFTNIMNTKFPDLRIGQLITIVFEKTDLFYVEDRGFIQGIKDYAEHISSANEETSESGGQNEGENN